MASMLEDLLRNTDNGSKNYSANYKSADSGWQTHSIRMSIAIVKSDIGKPAQKKEALTLEQQKRFVRGIVGNTLVHNQNLERRKPYKI